MDNHAASLFFNVTMSNIKLFVPRLFAKDGIRKIQSREYKDISWCDGYFGRYFFRIKDLNKAK